MYYPTNILIVSYLNIFLCQALSSFEKIGAIPVYLKDKNGADGKRASLSYQRFNNLVFSMYSIGICCVYVVRTMILFIYLLTIFRKLLRFIFYADNILH